MTATSTDRNTPSLGADAIPTLSSHPVKAATKCLQGTIAVLNAGYAAGGSTATGLIAQGIFEATVDNTAGLDGALTVKVRSGVFPFFNSASTDEITQADAGKDCWIVDNQTVAKTSGGNTRSRAGKIQKVESGIPYVLMGPSAIPNDVSPTATGRVVRGVVFANVASLAAFTVAGNDGLTYVEGERVLLTNQTTAAQNGIYVVGVVGAGTAPLTRATDFPTGATILNGSTVEVSEGTLWAGSTWKAMCTGTKVVGTDDPLFYPRVVKGTLTLASGTKTLGATEGLFLFSTTRSSIQLTRNTAGGTTTSTLEYQAEVASRTIGKSGTAAVICLAAVAAGTINTADNSTLDYLISNW